MGILRKDRKFENIIRTSSFQEQRGFKKYKKYKRYCKIIFCYILLPFYMVWKYVWKYLLYWLFDFLFYESVRNGSNVIGFGPAFDSYYSRKFSWGKLSFVVLVLLVIFLIFS